MAKKKPKKKKPGPKPNPAKKPLGAKEARLVDEYLVDLALGPAAIRAGYAVNGARQTAFKVLNRPNVAAELTRRQLTRREEAGSRADQVIDQLHAILSGVKYDERARVAAGGWLLRHYGLIKATQHEHAGKGGKPIKLDHTGGASPEFMASFKRDFLGIPEGTVH